MSYITKEDVYSAYRRLKNFLYYDNSALYAKYKIAEFEKDIDAKEGLLRSLKLVFEILDGKKNVSQLFSKEIRYKVVPKTVKSNGEETSKDDIRFFTNDNSQYKIEIEKFNYIIDAPIEIYILSVLWLMKVAPKFSNILTTDNYAYRFRIKGESKENKEEVSLSDSISIYQPYFIGYQEWRDNALNKVNELVTAKNDATLVSLDIQRYFYNIHLKLTELLTKEAEEAHVSFNSDDVRLSAIIDEIHQIYTKCIPGEIQLSTPYTDKGTDTMLPLGLPSSGFIANLYLARFDRLVKKNLNPDYYGRYVDDIMIVLKNCNTNNAKELFSSKLEGKILESEKSTNTDGYALLEYPNLSVQKQKVVIQNIVHTGSKAVLNSFMRTIKENSSEFNYLPDEGDQFSDFEDEAFDLEQDDSHNKLRDIKAFKANKFGASKFLSRRILFANILSIDSEKSKRESTQILEFFKGAVGIQNYTLWQKVATYFILKGDYKSLHKFYDNVKGSIDGIDILDDEKNALCEYLQLSIAFPLALNYKFAEQKNWLDNISSYARVIRSSNMFDHNLVAYPLFNYTPPFISEDDDTNLFSSSEMRDKLAEYFKKHTLNKDVFENRMVTFSPRIIKLHEICLFAQCGFINCGVNLKIIQGIYSYFLQTCLIPQNIANESLFEEKHVKIGNRVKCYISITDKRSCEEKENILRVAVSNISIPDTTLKRHRLGQREYNDKEIRNIFKVVNEAIENHVDLLVLPEWCMPYRLINAIMDKCVKNSMALVTGMKYTFNTENEKEIGYNMVATVLPLRNNHFSYGLITLRQKNHLAPGEELELQTYYIEPPKNEESIYYHYQWHNAYFSVYNCFELAEIIDRSLFKSEIDFIVATELNKDTNYYADIVGATVRDLHCYFIQSNSSTWGDSRITIPSKHEARDLVRVKGGKNPSVLVQDINLTKLREFQIKQYVGQYNDKSFKFTPPNFSKNNVEKRIHDERMLE